MNMAMVLYIKQMKRKNRVIPFIDDNLKAIVTYFITDNPKLKRNDWSIPVENNDGEYIYLDRLITDKNVGIAGIRHGVVDIIKYLSSKYPDKKILWHSRRGNEVYIKNS